METTTTTTTNEYDQDGRLVRQIVIVVHAEGPQPPTPAGRVQPHIGRSHQGS